MAGCLLSLPLRINPALLYDVLPLLSMQQSLEKHKSRPRAASVHKIRALLRGARSRICAHRGHLDRGVLRLLHLGVEVVVIP
jgi:hypothetical protein